MPRHPGITMDGNRLWGRRPGTGDPGPGRKYGAGHAGNVLNWCEKPGVRHVTVFVCSAGNLATRGNTEVAFLMQVIAGKLGRDPAWQGPHRRRPGRPAGHHVTAMLAAAQAMRVRAEAAPACPMTPDTQRAGVAPRGIDHSATCVALV